MAKDPLIGKQLANFRIDRMLGRGGMATVYYGMDVKLERPVAVKVIDTRLQGNPSYARRFVDEAKIVASWRHENIIQVYYADNEADLYFFAMEYIDGASLENLMARYVDDGEVMPHEDVLRIGRAVASALDYAHERHVVHRDVKPSNVMISHDDRVVLTDFGLALDTAQGSMGEVFGTPHYIAPEQARRSANAVPQSDLYALGVVLYEMLTGFVPFDDESATSIALQHISEPPPSPRYLNPNLNQATEDVLLKALAKEPEHRYQSGKALIDVLEAALQNRAISETPMVDSALPAPPPAAMQGREQTPQRRLSRLSLAEMLELQLSGQDMPEESKTPTPQRQLNPVRTPGTQEVAVTQAGQTSPAIPQSKATQAANPEPTLAHRPASSGNRGLIVGVGVAIVVALIVVAGLLFTRMSANSPAVPTSLANSLTQEAQTIVALAAATFTDIPTDVPSDTPVVPTDVPTSTIAPTDVPADTAVPTPIPPTNTVEVPATTTPPRDTLEPTIIPPTNTVEAAATPIPPTNTIESAAVPATPVAFPDGHLLELIYNSAGFYLRNASDTNIHMSRLKFQGFDAAGNTTGRQFSGGDWIRGYNRIDRGNCAAIELLDQPGWTRPICGRLNSLLTFQTSDNRIFWTGSNGSTQFALLWDDVEVARCPINAGECDIRVGD